MKASELIQRYNLEPHLENGTFIERHYPAPPGVRAPSGSMYYYLAPEEKSVFHVIDCDEYWCYHEGTALELWMIGPDHRLNRSLLGTGADAEPLIHIPAGTIFAARHTQDRSDGTFLSCITVPRFRYEGSRLLTRTEVCEFCPEAGAFWA